MGIGAYHLLRFSVYPCHPWEVHSPDLQAQFRHNFRKRTHKLADMLFL